MTTQKRLRRNPKTSGATSLPAPSSLRAKKTRAKGLKQKLEYDKRLGNRLEDYVRSIEPPTRSAVLLQESAERLKIEREALYQIIKPEAVYIRRLSVPILGAVVNIVSGIVLHDRARGPYKGGIRLAQDVDIWETNELARLMTLKTALAGVDLGGGKSGISINLRALHERMIREKRFRGGFREFARIAKIDIITEFARNFGWLFSNHEYIPAPDMGTSGAEIVHIYNMTNDPASVTGKPDGIEGALPGRREATGYGVFYAVLKHMERTGRSPDQCTAAIQGFGNVGSYSAKFLHEAGVKVIGITDMTGGLHDPRGIDVPALMTSYAVQGHLPVRKGKTLTNDELFRMKCDYLIPAATGHVLNEKNCKTVSARVVVEAANMPVTYPGMQVLQKRGIEIIPDTYANAGGVIASNAEYRQALGGMKYTRDMTLAYLRERFDAMYASMEPHVKKGRTLAEAGADVALSRVYETLRQRNMI
ncbi:MAG: Glu/Leu/Phe/Val dehydrogenase [Candidatus Hydrogenedentes bacterium]|nr:Glu/Leu/Phe/Val dehydrogenase [Candidatus Hydrogenedentota bacterium]